MSNNRNNWLAEAHSDALSTLDNFADDIAEQARDYGEVDDDLNNSRRYSGGDSYHHENHVDKSYSLTEAAELLDELDDFEETDSGLWEGLAPREAISAQAAYTYGAAVWSEWSDEITAINELLEGFDFEEDDDEEAQREGAARLYIVLAYHFEDAPSDDASVSEKTRYALAAAASTGLDTGDYTAALVLCDHLEEEEPTREYISKKIREAVALLQTKKEVEEEEDAEEEEETPCEAE